MFAPLPLLSSVAKAPTLMSSGSFNRRCSHSTQLLIIAFVWGRFAEPKECRRLQLLLLIESLVFFLSQNRFVRLNVDLRPFHPLNLGIRTLQLHSHRSGRPLQWLAKRVSKKGQAILGEEPCFLLRFDAIRPARL